MKVLITGGSQGIGKAIADACAKDGHDLFLVGREHRKLLHVAQQLEQEYGKPVHHRALDISKPAEVRALVAETKKEKFMVDVVFLNAGIWIDGDIAKTTPKTFHRIMEVNVASSFYFVHAFRSILKKSAYPRIIFTGSTAGLESHHHSKGSLYSVSKWATHGLAVNLRQELMSDGIGVTHIAPGNVVTPMWGRDAQPKRMLQAADIGTLAATLLNLSPQAVVEEIVVRPLHGNI
jgi:short-subunit dehydrogenase